ncbi:hypothetical protein QBC47DRAFT_145407 [Echria macrotheca]|uniref:Cyclin-like f-box protein n=1 Tax=Echria macrotheca TaxID=438768 RepID=A0AAJ0F910_9PEZI|nr:hypothetical protein QBC47DRAFT_145407 [Echria macrotheca]
MLTILSTLLLVLPSLIGNTYALPQRNRNGGNANQGGTGQGKGQASTRVTTATDGSSILDTTVNVNGVPLRFKVSGPASEFTTLTSVTGASSAPNSTGKLGLNVLLHGDGGQSFFDFPNQAVQGNLMGVVVLAPSEQLLWGQRTGPPSGLSRPDGAADSQAVRDLVKQVLPQVIAFDPANVFFTGVSGGSLTLSGFFIPAHLSEFPNTGVLLMCGGLVPQVDVVDAAGFITNSKIHFQSTQQELELLQPAIPAAIKAYEALAAGQGLNARQIGALQTVDNTPNGGHCEFDEAGFSSGIQLISNNFASIMQGGNGAVQGINAKTVLKSVVGNENLKFAAAAA